MLLSIDVALIVLHLVNYWRPIGDHNAFYLEDNNSYAELYQNIKWVAMILLSMLIAHSTDNKKYYSWTVIFLFLFLEDVFRVHQEVASFISAYFFSGMATRQWKLLEILIASAIGLIVIAPLVWNYIKAETLFKQRSKIVIALLIMLVFFGIGMDQAHRLYFIWKSWKREFIVGIIEDGGEMITATYLLAYQAMLIISPIQKNR